MNIQNIAVDANYVKPLLHKREKDSHKGTYGHALLIAGSTGKTGAALLASEACLRSGVGLLTTHLPKAAMLPLQVYLPEAMISVDELESYFSQVPDLQSYNAIGVGPGLGKAAETVAALKKLLKEVEKPMVLDADAFAVYSRYGAVYLHRKRNDDIMMDLRRDHFSAEQNAPEKDSRERLV